MALSAVPDEDIERDLVRRSALLDTVDEYREWDRECLEFVNTLRVRCRIRRQRMCVGPYFSQIARLVRIEGLRDVVRRRFERVGADGRLNDRRSFFWVEVETAFVRRVLTGAIVNVDYIDPRSFMEDARERVLDELRNVMSAHGNVKVNTAFNGEFVSGEKRSVKTIATKNQALFVASDLSQWYDTCVIQPIIASLEEFQERESGWALSRILNLTVNVNKYNPMRAGCILHLPREILLKKAVVNVRSYDNKCFAWAVVASLYPAVTHTERMSSYPDYSMVLHLEGIDFPITLDQITKFERLNNVSVNVFTVEEARNRKGRMRVTVLPLHLTDNKRERHANLLYLCDVSLDNHVGHFVTIRNLSRLVSTQLTMSTHKVHICDR